MIIKRALSQLHWFQKICCTLNAHVYNIIQLLNGNAGNRPEYLAFGTGNDPWCSIALGLHSH